MAAKEIFLEKLTRLLSRSMGVVDQLSSHTSNELNSIQ